MECINGYFLPAITTGPVRRHRLSVSRSLSAGQCQHGQPRHHLRGHAGGCGNRPVAVHVQRSGIRHLLQPGLPDQRRARRADGRCPARGAGAAFRQPKRQWRCAFQLTEPACADWHEDQPWLADPLQTSDLPGLHRRCREVRQGDAGVRFADHRKRSIPAIWQGAFVPEYRWRNADLAWHFCRSIGTSHP